MILEFRAVFYHHTGRVDIVAKDERKAVRRALFASLRQRKAMGESVRYRAPNVAHTRRPGNDVFDVYGPQEADGVIGIPPWRGTMRMTCLGYRSERRAVSVGERIAIECPWSEVCLHMRVADKPMLVELIGSYPMAQLYTLDGRLFSAPILPQEAGILERDGTFFADVLVAAS